MKLAFLVLFLSAALLNAAEEQNSAKDSSARKEAVETNTLSASQRFAEADICLAVAQYKRYMELAFEVELQLQREDLEEPEREKLEHRIRNFRVRADALRAKHEK